MNEGEVSGYDDVECPFCGHNSWSVRVENSYDGPHVHLFCTTENCCGCPLISINQSMVLY